MVSSLTLEDHRTMTSRSAATPTDWKRVGLSAFLASVGLNALIAIAMILGGGGDTEWRVLGTSLLLSAASIGLIANAAAVDRMRLGPLPYASGTAVVAATVLGIVAIWTEPDADAFYQWMATAGIVGAAGSFSSLVALPNLSASYVWLRWSAVALAGALASLGIIAVWTMDDVPVELWGVLAVLLTAVTIVIPVLARVDERDRLDSGADAIGFCPVCGADLTAASGREVECPRCAASFSVTINGRPLAPQRDSTSTG